MGVAYWLQKRSRQESANAILEALLNEAIDDLHRLCYITELHCIGSRSKASIPRAARLHMMNQLASLTNNSAPLTHLTTAYSNFDRITAYQDQAVESDAQGDEKQASYAQGVAVAFIRSCIAGILENLDSVSGSIQKRIRVPDDVRERVELIIQFRDDVPVFCAIGTVCVKSKEGNSTVREVMKHLRWMQAVGLLSKSEKVSKLLSRMRGQYFAIQNSTISLLPCMESATRAATWNE